MTPTQLDRLVFTCMLTIGILFFGHVYLIISDEITAGQTKPVVISTDHTKCFGPDEIADRTILLERIKDCQRIIQELTDQAHDEFDMD